LFLDQKVIITRRTPDETYFDLAPNMKLEQYAQGTITQPSFVRVYPKAPIEYPNTATLRADFYLTENAASTTALSAVQIMPPQNIYVGINLAEQENWNAARLRWPFVLKQTYFENANEFVDWYNGLRSGNTVYEAKFTTGAITSLTEFYKIATAILDTGGYSPTPAAAPNNSTNYPNYWSDDATAVPITSTNKKDGKFISTNNANKRLSLDLSNGALAAGVNTLAGNNETSGNVLPYANKAFYGCANLRVLDLSGTCPIAAVDQYSFKGCTNLATLKLPTGLTVLGTDAASDIPVLSGLNNLKILDTGGLTRFANDCLGTTMILDELYINNVAVTAGVLNTTKGGFEGSRIRALFIGSNVTFGAYGFAKSTNLVKVEFPATYDAKSIPAGAFMNCSALSNVKFPWTSWATSGTIGENAFAGCGSLQTVTLPIIPPDIMDAKAFGIDDAALRTLTLGGNLQVNTQSFANKKELRTVILNAASSVDGYVWSSAVTSIPAATLTNLGVFEGCTRLQNVSFPTTGFTVIGDRAFKDCRLLDTNLPNTLGGPGLGGTAIGSYAFENCVSIESITIPSGVGVINVASFKNTGLRELVIPQNIVHINSNAFEDCKNLTKVTLKNTTALPLAVNLFGDAGTTGRSFAGCTSLETFGAERLVSGVVTGPEVGVCAIPAIANLRIKPNTFENTKFSKIVIDSVGDLAISGNAFSGAQFKADTLEVKGTTIASAGYDFSGTANAVPSIKTVIWNFNTLPANVKFDNTGLQTLVLQKIINTAPTATYPTEGFTTLKIDLDDQFDDLSLGLPNTIKYVIVGEKENGTGIRLGGNTNMLPASVEKITFTGAVGNVGTASTYFFGGLSDVVLRIDNAGVNIPVPNVANRGVIPASSFTGDQFKEVQLGALVKNVNADTNFVGASLKAINVDSGSDYYDNFQNDSVLYSKSGGTRVTIIRYPPAKDDVTNYTTPIGVTGIGELAFKGNATIEELTINTTIQNIANQVSTESVFEGMSGLTKVNFLATRLSNSGLATDSVFPPLADNAEFEVVFGEDVTRIPASFAGTAITELIIPVKVVDMNASAFVGCANLTDVRFEAENLSKTSTGAFTNVASLVKLNFGNGVKVIPDNTFEGTGVKFVDPLKSIVYIGAGAFENCENLAGTFDIPASCTEIGNTAFGGTTPPTVSRFIIRGSNVDIKAITAFKQAGTNAATAGDLFTLYGTQKAGNYVWSEKTNPDDNTWIWSAID
jgi:hypothetical protein